MNLITDLTARIEERRTETKEPCKNYATQAAAEKATSKMAMDAAEYFHGAAGEAASARYVVFFNEAWGRWVGAIDLTELLNRKSSTGGYLGFCTGFYTY